MNAAALSDLVKRVALRLWRVAGRVFGRCGVLASARFDVARIKDFRSDAFFYAALAKAGTVRLPPDKLYDLRRWLDLRSYLALLSRTRPEARPDAVRVEPAGGENPQAPRLAVSTDYYAPEPAPNVVFSPYFLHPAFYADGSHRTLHELARRSRRVRLVFAGSSDARAYRDDFHFPILNRHQIVEYLLDTFRAETCLIERRGDLPRLAQSDRPIVVVRTGDTRDRLDKHILSPGEYLRLLADSEFALCPPGCRMPHSHNIIEAMGVFAIPVTNYAGYLRPPLTHGLNCLGFDTLPGLGAVVREALAAAPERLRDLRAGVRDYAERELAVGAFASKLRAALQGGRDAVVCVNDEDDSIRLFRERHP